MEHLVRHRREGPLEQAVADQHVGATAADLAEEPGLVSQRIPRVSHSVTVIATESPFPGQTHGSVAQNPYGFGGHVSRYVVGRIEHAQAAAEQFVQRGEHGDAIVQEGPCDPSHTHRLVVLTRSNAHRCSYRIRGLGCNRGAGRNIRLPLGGARRM